MFDKIKKVIDDYKAVMRERREVLELERAERKEQFNQWREEVIAQREVYRQQHPIRYQLNRAMAYSLLVGVLAGAGFGAYHLAKKAETNRFLREVTNVHYNTIEYVNPEEEQCRREAKDTQSMLECIVKFHPDAFRGIE